MRAAVWCTFVFSFVVLTGLVMHARPGLSQGPARTGACPPVESRQPNATSQQPAFPEQTRACAVRSGVAFEVVVLARGLEKPWAVEPLPDGGLLVTEKPGRLRIV